MCLFFVYFCLLIITTKAIIKANAMIVTDTRPANNNFIINNKVVISTIRLTSSYVGGKPHLLILISYNYYTLIFLFCQIFCFKNLRFYCYFYKLSFISGNKSYKLYPKILSKNSFNLYVSFI